MPAVEESCVSTRLTSLAADCVETWEAECYTRYSTRSRSIISTVSNPNALWLHHLHKGITIISAWLRVIKDKMLLKSKLFSRLQLQQSHQARYFQKERSECSFLMLMRQVSSYPPCHDKCTQYRPCFACQNTAPVLLPSKRSGWARSCWLHLNICKHFPHATWEEESCMAMLLTEGSTVLKQMQRWNNSLES